MSRFTGPPATRRWRLTVPMRVHGALTEETRSRGRPIRSMTSPVSGSSLVDSWKAAVNQTRLTLEPGWESDTEATLAACIHPFVGRLWRTWVNADPGHGEQAYP